MMLWGVIVIISLPDVMNSLETFRNRAISNIVSKVCRIIKTEYLGT